MKVRSRFRPFAGEKLVDVIPALAPFIADAPLRRLHFFPGRHLTDSALKLEQAVRVARLRLRAQGVTAGVVRGLEIGLGYEGDHSHVQIGTGYGLGPEGEDIVVDRPLRLPVRELPVFTPGTAPDKLLKLDQLEPVGEGATAGVLLLQPGYLEELEVPLAAKAAGLEAENFQPVETQPADLAYYRRTLVDATRLVICLWSSEWPAAWRLPAPSNAWQNEVAWRIFAAEQKGEVPPWAEYGLPVGLLGLDENWMPLFLDRHAVAREGGRPRQRTFSSRVLSQQIGGTGNQPLWQARMDQFAAELAQESKVAAGAKRFRFLPPFGILPRAFVEWRKQPVTDTVTKKKLRTVRNAFFPDNYAVHLAVAPIEQLDAVAASARSLRPYDLTQPDRVLLLAPVPQTVFDPQLLEVEEIPEEFQKAVNQLTAARNLKLDERDDLRAREGRLAEAVVGPDKKPAYPSPDPGRLDPAEKAEGYTPLAGEQFGTTGADSTVTVAALATLKNELDQRYRGTDPNARPAPWLDVPEQAGLTAYYQAQNKIKDEEYRAATSAFSRGLNSFLEYLDGKINHAEELLDSHFLKVRTDVYRLGQLVSGSTLVTRFATSDALSSLVQRQTAAADTKGITAFASQLVGSLPSETGNQPAANAPATKSGPAAAEAAKSFKATANPLMMALGRKPIDVQLNTDAEGKITAAQFDSGLLIDAVKADLLANKELFQTTTLEPSFGTLPFLALKKLPLERLQPPAAVQIRQEISDSKVQLFEKLMGFNLCLLGLATSFVDKPASGAPFRPLRLAEVFLKRETDEDLGVPPAEADANVTQKNTEAAHFARGVQHADLALAALRAIERRIKEYQEIADLCRKTRDEIQGHLAALQARLHQVDSELAEARQDAAVAQALLAEETKRVAAVNQHREQVLAESVTFFVFHRPRALDPHMDRPVRTVHPALTESPVPAALREDLEVPPDLLALQQVFRDSPVRWFRLTPQWLIGVDRLPVLRDFVQVAVTRAPAAAAVATTVVSAGRFAKPLQSLLEKRTAGTAEFRRAAQAIPLGGLLSASWQDLARHAEEALTLGQFLDHGPGILARSAAEELQNIFKVAAAVHRDFSKTSALLRLRWAEQFSQLDAPASFRDLARLPRWNEVEFTLRRQLQLLVDWLYARIHASIPDAVALMDDLVRVGLLLASHAPVDALVTGEVAEKTQPSVGGRFRIKVDMARIRVGMGVVADLGANRLVRAVVDDVSSGEASVRVTAVPAGAVVELTAATPVRFVASGRF